MNLLALVGIPDLKRIMASGDKRYVKAKKNILSSFFIKGGNILVGLYMVPLTLHCLDATRYGIWITLSSIIAWFGFFDIGLGNGLRNRFAEALAKGEYERARKYISTTYALVGLLMLGAWSLFFVVNKFLNWARILNAVDMQNEFNVLALVLFTLFCARLVLNLLVSILTADQEPAKAASLDLWGKLLAAAGVFVLTKIKQSSLLYLGVVISGAPVLVLLIASVWLYGTKYKPYRPSFKLISFGISPDLMNIGIKFFFLQISAIVIYETNNIIIAQLFGPAEVTPYSVAFRYFSVLMMGFTVVLAPFWSAFTDAWTRREIDWIENGMKTLFRAWILLLVLTILMLASSSLVYEIWLGKDVDVQFSLSMAVAAYVVISAWNGIYSSVLNGLSKVKLQLHIGIIAAVLNIPLALAFGGSWGIHGVVLAGVLLNFVGAIIYPIQYKRLITNQATGIWDK